MGKQPATQFYFKDWRSDTQLQMASHTAKGIWIDMLCLMWESPQRGLIKGPEKQIAKMVGANRVDFGLFMNEIQRYKFGDLTICNNEIQIINRRMYREQKVRENTRLRVQKHREKHEKRKSNANVTSLSSSPSPSSPSKKNKFVVSARRIFEFWQEKLKKPGSKFTPERERKILARLEDGYSVEDCLKAIENCSRSPFHRGENENGKEYVDINLIFRNGEKLEYFRDMVFKGPKGRGGLKGVPKDWGEK